MHCAATNHKKIQMILKGFNEMVRTISLFLLILSAATFLMSCDRSDLTGYRKTRTEIHYKFEKENSGAIQPKVGDVLFAEMEVKFNDSLIFSNYGNPQRILHVEEPKFPGDLNEGLLMMHRGDIANFALWADTLVNNGIEMPLSYKQGTGQRMHYRIALHEIVSQKDLQNEQNQMMAQLEYARQNEPKAIAKYIEDKHIAQDSCENGMYMIKQKEGLGNLLETGESINFDFSIYSLDEVLVNTNDENKARENGIYNPEIIYEKAQCIVGNDDVLPALNYAFLRMKHGDAVRLVVPSKLAYGDFGWQGIPPYAPLIFEISVE